MNRESALRKVRACLARAQSSNENERATALRQATRLMDKYNITRTEADDELNRGVDLYRTGRRRWQLSVIKTIANLYGCECYHMTRNGGSAAVVGLNHVRPIVLEIADWIISSIVLETNRIELNEFVDKKRWRRSFKEGAAAGVYKTARQIIKERARGDYAESKTKALVTVEHYKNELERSRQWLEQQAGGAVRKLADKSSFRLDAAAAMVGFNYGASINLNKQVEIKT